MQGLCKSGVCVCQPGYRGSYCEIPPACAGILDQDGNCCATGIVSQNGTCCAQASMPSPRTGAAATLTWFAAAPYKQSYSDI